MNHDELLAKLDNRVVNEDSDTCNYLALRAVVELHKSIQQTTGFSYTQDNGLVVLATDFICKFCQNAGAIEHRYPCPTIQAIEKELA